MLKDRDIQGQGDHYGVFIAYKAGKQESMGPSLCRN